MQGKSKFTNERRRILFIYWTPLHYAASVGNFNIFKELFQAGAVIDVFTSDGTTPLHLACMSGSYNIVNLLLQNGCTSVNIPDSKGDTPLILAATSGVNTIVDALIEKGAQVNDVNAKHSFPYVVENLLSHNADYSLVDIYMNTPLTKAKTKGNEAVMRLLDGAVKGRYSHKKRLTIGPQRRPSKDALFNSTNSGFFNQPAGPSRKSIALINKSSVDTFTNLT